MQLLLIACLSQSRWSGAQDLTLFLWAGSINSCRLCTLCISDQASWSCLHIAHQHRPVLHSITPMCHALIRLMPIPAHIPQTHMHWSTQFRHSLRSELSIAKCHHDLVGRMSDHIIWSTMVTYDQSSECISSPTGSLELISHSNSNSSGCVSDFIQVSLFTWFKFPHFGYLFICFEIWCNVWLVSIF